MKIYVASKFSNREAVRQAHALLRSAGHEITYDWVDDDAKCGPEGMDEHDIPRDRAIARTLASYDVEGIRDADVLVFLPVEQGGRGCYVEMGIACALGIPVVVQGPHFNSIFMYLPGVHSFNGPFAALAEQLEEIIGRIKRDRPLELDLLLASAPDPRVFLRDSVIAVIAKYGMQASLRVEIEAHVIHDLFVDLDRSRALQREAEDQAARAIARLGRLEGASR